MSYGDSLTLKEAAKFAGVSEGTMRTWTKSLQNIKRVAGGGYQIPRDELQAYLSFKHARPIKGATASPSPLTKGKGTGSKEGAMEAQLRAENERLILQATKKDEELQAVRADLREAQADIRKLEAAMRAYLSGTGLTGALARIFQRSR